MITDERMSAKEWKRKNAGRDRGWDNDLVEAFAAAERKRVLGPVVEALKLLYDETADYIRINNLGDVHHNVSMQQARDALAKYGPKE